MSMKRELTTSDTDEERETTTINDISKKQKTHLHASTLRNKDDFILVWYDEQPASPEIISVLEPLCNDVYYFQNSAHCLMYIESLNVKEHVFLIISSLCIIVDDAHKLRQVDTIFLYATQHPSSISSPTSLKTTYTKIVIVSDSERQLVDSITNRSIELSKQHELFNLYNHKQQAFCNLSESSTSFLWFQLFKKMLIDMPKEDIDLDKNDKAKEYMIKHCYDYYRHNQTQLKNIAEFEATYTPSNAIRWYTSDTFVYKLINKALRTEDMEVLHTFRFFIIDLCNNLAEKYKEMLELEVPLPSIVYRGTQMNKDEIETLAINKGCLIGTNGFLSTSRIRDVAKFYAGSGVMNSNRRGEIHAVIFELIIPSDLQSITFADISYLSKMIDEQEVLFDLGTTFVISDVVYDDTEQIWNIRLTGSDKGRNIVTKEYIDYYREHTMYLSPTIKLGEFLIVVGQFEKAREYFESLLKCDYDNEVHILYNLAWIDKCQGKYIDAQTKLDRAYELEMDNDVPSQNTLRNILIDSGTLYLTLNKFNLAMNCFLQADRMSSTSAAFNNIGLTYRHKCQWDNALEFFNKALALDKHNWPNGHYRIGIILDNIGRTYNDLGKYRKALGFHLQGLRMKQQTLPNDHMDIGISFNNVGFTYDSLEMYDKALTYYRRALNIYQICLPKIHIELGILLDNMAIAYRFKNQFKECFEYHRQALDIKERLNPLNSLTLAQTLHNIGVAYADRHVNNDQQDDVKAFEYFRRSISMHELNKSLQSPAAASTFYEQGRLHERRQEYQRAFDFLIKALTIQQTILKRNHPATWNTRDALIGLKIEL